MATDLTTLANAKAWLGITDSSEDSTLPPIITAASERVRQFLQRDPVSGSRTETRDGTGSRIMVVKNYPLTAVSSVSVDGISISAASSVTTAGYRFNDTTIVLTGYLFTRGLLNVSLSYTAGYASGSDQLKLIERATLMTVQAIHDAPDVDVNLTGESVPGVYSAQYRSDGVGSLPPGARDLLNPFRRVVTA